ncbi:TPA: fimbrial protein [Citrobacter koseri]|nr:fimbrial protein [Citrobacter koseri]
MENKKKHIIAAAVSILFVANAHSAIQGEAGTVEFTGQIVAPTCSVSPGSLGQTVDLGLVSAEIFNNGGKSTAKDFSIELVNCNIDTATHASVLFSGETLTDETILKTSDSDTTKIGIEILQDGTPIILDGVTPTSEQELVIGENSLRFAARYTAVSPDFSPGEANATANFIMQYE